MNRGIASDSKELAAASKRDSASMKIIAILTTAFLPGTFISALSAIPLFDREVPSVGEVMGCHFWFYWAISIPLTLLVIGIFGLYALFQDRKNTRTAQEAREITGIREPVLKTWYAKQKKKDVEGA
ncbi:hypothetical protein B0H67DRAFT_23833 [Lasiosphaeris hirsuta]|uniref:Uncharacterized protein n=1 Tax=Lasiosphaeris hirsuta TaxID=260670 RepID=A0AA40B9I5_9PEZI|nr:hypothetical protein B0H67DRAFT_23833 [Lasiosphaeris hirsuta]